MVTQHHQRTPSVLGIDASSGIGKYDGSNAHAREDAYRKGYLLRRIAFVQVYSTLHHRQRNVFQLADDKPAGVADGGALGKVRNLGVGDADSIVQFVSKAAES